MDSQSRPRRRPPPRRCWRAGRSAPVRRGERTAACPDIPASPSDSSTLVNECSRSHAAAPRAARCKWHHGRRMTIPKQITFVTFDVYGTLIDWETGAYEAFKREADRDGFTIERDELI